MTLTLLAVTIDAHDPAALSAFWAGVLGRTAVEGEDGAWWVGGAEPELTLRFAAGAGERAGLDRMHCDLTNATPEDQEAHVAAALAAGASHLDVGQRGDEGHVVLADPEGNAFDEIEAGNRFLAGTGRLGCLACDGSEQVGRFWSAALGWPLVWDQDGETAIQSPRGGSKISWGGEDPEPLAARSRVRLHLAMSEAPADQPQTWELSDPDGTAFTVLSGTTGPYG